jgi:hypothetical protein
MADDKDTQADAQEGDGPAEPPLTDVESPLVDDEAHSDKDDGHGWIPPIP